ncbi:MAG: methyltransferase, partial [Rhizobiaceae bacterium]
LSGRFGGIEARFVHPRADAPAIRCLLRGRKGSRARLTVLPPLILHEDGTGRFAPEAEAAINGALALFPD